MRYLRPPTLFLAPLFLLASPIVAQGHLALAARTPSPERGSNTVNPLRAMYQVRLTSDWPQYTTGAGCANGGEELLTGTLQATAAGYAGTFRRTATIRFCGSHGQVSECALTLMSTGPVAATARVYSDGASPMLLLRWVAPEEGGDTEVSGDCPPAFEESVRRLYLTVAHTLEVPLPASPAGHAVRLDDYGWIAEIR